MRALLGLLVLLVLGAAPAAAADVPALGRTTVVSGGPGTTSMLVDVRQPLSLDAARSLAPIASLDAGGRGFGSVYLRRVGPANDYGVQWSIRFLYGAGAQLGWHALLLYQRDSLPAGRYRLYVSSSEALRTTLTLPSLEADATLAPAEAEPAQLKPLEPNPLAPPGVIAFGGDGELAGEGEMLVFGVFPAREDDGLPERAGLCQYSGGSRPGDPTAYAPGCPGGKEVPFVFPTGTGSIGVLGRWIGFDPGRYGLGWNFEHTGGSDGAFGWALWEPARDDGQQPGVTSVPEPPAPQSAPPRGAVTIPARYLRVRRGRIRVPLRCNSEGPCAGTVALGRRRARFTLPAGHRGRVVLRAPRRVRRVTLVLTTETSGGVSQVRVPVRLRRR
jgi:hypothetical protein